MTSLFNPHDNAVSMTLYSQLNDVTLTSLCCNCSDRIRTSVNVLGDAYGAGIVHHLYRHELEQLNREEKEQQQHAAGNNQQEHETFELEPTPLMHRNNVNKGLLWLIHAVLMK